MNSEKFDVAEKTIRSSNYYILARRYYINDLKGVQENFGGKQDDMT